MTLTSDRLREVLDFDQKLGIFTWKAKTSPQSRVNVGDVAGSADNGYTRIRIDGKLHKAHRLAWFWLHGKWPTKDIDHRNGARSDNSESNLREVNRTTNSQNRRSANSLSSTKLLGVKRESGPRSKPFRAMIKVDGKRVHIGYYADPMDAFKAYVEAKRKLHEGNML